MRLPAPLAHLANRPHGRYRLSAPAGFSYRGSQVAAQAATGAVRYDISCDPVRGRWYLDASWTAAPALAPCLDALRAHPVLAVDLNHGHLAAWAVTPDGNPAGPPVTVSLALSGLPASQRDGRLRTAISAVIGLARQRGCRAIVIEDLDFADARDQGRERYGSRPSRGRRGRSYRALVSELPTGRFRDRLVQMAANAGLAVIAADPAYTSRWGAEHWLGPLRDRVSPVPASGHHAAAVVIGRRALGHRARRRAGVTGGGQRTSRRRAAPRAPAATRATRDGRPRQAHRQPHPRRKTATATRTRPPNQAAQDRPGPPTSQEYLLLVQQERLRRSGLAVGAQAPEGDFGLVDGVAEAGGGLQAGRGLGGAVHVHDPAAAPAYEVMAVVVAGGDSGRSLHVLHPTGLEMNERVLLRRC